MRRLGSEYKRDGKRIGGGIKQVIRSAKEFWKGVMGICGSDVNCCCEEVVASGFERRSSCIFVRIAGVNSTA